MRKALLEIIELNLVLKFGTEALDLFFRIKRISDFERLKRIRELIIRARSIEDIESFLKE
ncbi:MAG: hypothetical protein J7M13_05725 [Synergistetes bacterium]|nr:hypothetical protein [Synergistota bacterium]